MARAQKSKPKAAESRPETSERHAQWQNQEEDDLERLDNEGGFHESPAWPGHARTEDKARRGRPHLSAGEPRPPAPESDEDETSPLAGGRGYGLGFSYGYDRDNMTGGDFAGSPEPQDPPATRERERTRAPRKRPLPRKPGG
jgi:hypothetical protein